MLPFKRFVPLLVLPLLAIAISACSTSPKTTSSHSATAWTTSLAKTHVSCPHLVSPATSSNFTGTYTFEVMWWPSLKTSLTVTFAVVPNGTQTRYLEKWQWGTTPSTITMPLVATWATDIAIPNKNADFEVYKYSLSGATFDNALVSHPTKTLPISVSTYWEITHAGLTTSTSNCDEPTLTLKSLYPNPSTTTSSTSTTTTTRPSSTTTTSRPTSTSSTTTTTAGPHIQSSVSHLTFVSIIPGHPVTQTVNITNSGGGSLTVTSTSFSGTYKTKYAVTSNNCHGITAGSSCTITVSATPALRVTNTATLVIGSNGGSVTISLKATST